MFVFIAILDQIVEHSLIIVKTFFFIFLKHKNVHDQIMDLYVYFQKLLASFFYRFIRKHRRLVMKIEMTKICECVYSND